MQISIGEEGLDTPSCNVVIRYDEITTVTGLIQSRGRARAIASKFVLIDDQKLAILKQKVVSHAFAATISFLIMRSYMNRNTI
jgi:ERCC4-related helicase